MVEPTLGVPLPALGSPVIGAADASIGASRAATSARKPSDGTIGQSALAASGHTSRRSRAGQVRHAARTAPLGRSLARFGITAAGHATWPLTDEPARRLKRHDTILPTDARQLHPHLGA
jgi:hypothetical protein